MTNIYHNFASVISNIVLYRCVLSVKMTRGPVVSLVNFNDLNLMHVFLCSKFIATCKLEYNSVILAASEEK